MKSTTLLVAALATVAVQAHTWIEQLISIAPNGTFVGTPGYARGNVLRSTHGFTDSLMVNLLPPDGGANVIQDSDLMCKSTQTSATQSDGSPRLQGAPGGAVALRYQENGHVTLPQNQPGKPANRGTVFVYGTTQPQSTDTFNAIHKVWNADGTGGDKRGKLISTQNFDDGQCYQVNSGTISQQRQKEFPHPASDLEGGDIWCQQDVAIPSDAPSGQPYTMYWVWDWPTAAGVDPGLPDGKIEIYTTCIDIDVSSGAGGNEEQSSSGFVQGQNPANAAIASELANIADPTAVSEPAGSSPSAVSTGASSTGESSGSSGSVSSGVSSSALSGQSSSAFSGQTSSAFSSQPTVGSSAGSSSPAEASTGAAGTTIFPMPPSGMTQAVTQATASPSNSQSVPSQSFPSQSFPSQSIPSQSASVSGGHFTQSSSVSADKTSSFATASVPSTVASVPTFPGSFSMATETQFDSTTMTVYQTMFTGGGSGRPSGFRRSSGIYKRTVTETHAPHVPQETPRPSAAQSMHRISHIHSHVHNYRVRGRNPFFIVPDDSPAESHPPNSTPAATPTQKILL